MATHALLALLLAAGAAACGGEPDPDDPPAGAPGVAACEDHGVGIRVDALPPSFFEAPW